ncbi:vWA domain-containing protein [Pseudobacteroides cellulosolvens]|uniref:von Willebrand factor type A n=1 Tax=Pseudobacteroides cellulosolvens ATCC 35603 = DSM 2933 TaxID=398512 RepID=A0A0L6JTD6_9FIRM|nr:VWA domain-containing protein [Pseudobacteroides cellulosolvens]KNY28677.1 von Willebrand factor type A [Pseudobacteroides cellulosolvens ATCC 35603 = DSM 2933]
MNNFEFEQPLYILFGLIPITGFIVMILAYRKKEKILDVMKIKTIIPFKVLRNILITLGLCLMVVSLMGPQIFMGYAEVSKKGMDIYVLIDTSKSMLVEDIQPNRISRVKKIIEGIIDNLQGDRIGFIPFSQDAYVQMPLTDDYQLARMFLDVIDTDMIAGGGTNIASAIKLADSSFKRVTSADRVIIVLSDGEELDSNSQEVVKNIKDKQLKVFTIGVGSDKGGLIPVYDEKSNQRISYKKDNKGDFVTSRLNADILKKLADIGNGTYYQASLSGDEIQNLLKDIGSLKRDTSKTDKIKRLKSQYQYFLGAGILLFTAACLLPERRKLV